MTFDTVTTWLLLGTLALPWLSLVLLASPGLRPWALLSLPLTPLIALVLAIFPAADSVEWQGLLLGSQFGVDAVNRVFLGVTGIAWLAAAVLATAFVRQTSNPNRFVSCFLLSMAGNFALVLSQDTISFYTAFALMSLSAYGLVNHRGDDDSIFAGRIYIVLAIAGELLLFAGMLGIAHGATDLQYPLLFETRPADWTIACVVLGFGIKAGLVPLHVSLPLSYAAAPHPAGVALAGAMLNAGLLGWLRWLPIGSFDLALWGMLFVGAGLLGTIYGVVLGVQQRLPRALLGYSSISQVGLMMLFIGAGLLAPDHWSTILPLLMLFVLHHALAKTALFCASAGHLPRHWPFWLWGAVLALPALALIGVPLSSGFVAKMGLKSALTSGSLSALIPWLSLASLGTTLLMVRWFFLVLRAPVPVSPVRYSPWVTVAIVFVLLAAPYLTSETTVAALALGTTAWTASWPALLGMVLAAAIWRYRPPPLCALIAIAPNGDIASPVSRWLSLLMIQIQRISAGLEGIWQCLIVVLTAWFDRLWRLSQGTPTADDHDDWTRSITTFLLVLVVITIFLTLS